MAEALRILIADDDPDDAFALKSALSKSGYLIEMDIVSDGQAVLMRLDPPQDLAESEWTEDPSVILLDLEMPGMTGLEVLRRLKGSAELRHLPVVVFSGHQDKETIAKAYHLGANAYFEKPHSKEAYESVVSTLVGFWKQAA